MNKVIRDGKVAILYSPGHGAGWYSWHGREELLFDPKLVELVENEAGGDAIIEYCESKYLANQYYFGGADQLSVFWIDEGTEFFIDEYDGAESVVTKDDISWITA
jgi:hypothetical protein